MDRYLALIDESGESGIKKIRTEGTSGASPYLCIGGVLMPESTLKTLTNLINASIYSKIKRKPHFSSYNHKEKIFISKKLGNNNNDNILYFCIISYKNTLGKYKEQIDKDPIKYYHKCAAYALEIIGKMAKEIGINRSYLHIRFEKNNSLNISNFKNYIRKIQRNPIYEECKNLNMINPDNIEDINMKQYTIGIIPDFVASSIYSCFNRDRNGNIEFRYLIESYKKYYCNEKGIILGYGIKPIHNLDEINPDNTIKNILSILNAKKDFWERPK